MNINFPCAIRPLRHQTFGAISVSPGEYIRVVISEKQNSGNRYKTVELKTSLGDIFFTDEALKNAIKRGDFELV